MQSFVYDYLFLILLILGGVIVTVRSTELYCTPAPGNDAQWLNDQIHLRHLTGLRQYATGFLFYLSPVLLVYLLISVSPELLSISMGIAGTTSSVGALTLSGSEVYTFAPVLAATAVITLLNVKPFSIVEQHLRRMSHGIAGIPQHVQDIINQIRNLEFEPISNDTSLRKMQLNADQPMPGLDNDLVAIDNMHEWIFGVTGAVVWSDKAKLALELRVQRISDQYNAIKRKLMYMRFAIGDQKTIASPLVDEASENIAKQARELRIHFNRLLAVSIANQDETLTARAIPEPLLKLVTTAQARRASSHHFNTLSASTLTGIVISTPIAAFYNFMLIIFNELSINGTSLDIHNNQLLISGNSPNEFYISSLLFATESAFWDVIGISLIFFAGCAIALNYRAGRVNTETWGLWHSRNYPIIQYVAIAIVATVGAALLYETFLFFKLVVWPSLQMRSTGHFASMVGDFGRYYVQFGALAILAIPSAIMACRLCDKMGTPSNYPNLWRDSQVRLLILTVGVAVMILYILLRIQLNASRDLTVVFSSAPIPSITLLIMTASFWRIGELRPPNVLLLPTINPADRRRCLPPVM